LARVVGAHHVDYVAAPVIQAQRLEAEHTLGGAPVLLQATLAGSLEGGGAIGKRLSEETERDGLAAPLEDEFVGGGLRGRRRAEEATQRAEALRPVFGGEGEAAPLFQCGERIQLVEQAFGAGTRLAFAAEEERPQLAQAGVGD